MGSNMLNKMSPSMVPVLLLVNWVTEALFLAASSTFKILLCGCYKEVTVLNMVHGSTVPYSGEIWQAL